MTDQVKVDRRDSIAWCSIGYVAGKRGDRKILEDGLDEKVALQIDGKIGRQKFQDIIAGRLTIGHPQESATSSAVAACDVVAALLNQMPDDESRAKSLQRLVEEFEKHKGEFLTPADLVEQSKACLKRLRSERTVTKAGNLVFETA